MIHHPLYEVKGVTENFFWVMLYFFNHTVGYETVDIPYIQKTLNQQRQAEIASNCL